DRHRTLVREADERAHEARPHAGDATPGVERLDVGVHLLEQLEEAVPAPGDACRIGCHSTVIPALSDLCERGVLRLARAAASGAVCAAPSPRTRRPGLVRRSWRV